MVEYSDWKLQVLMVSGVFNVVGAVTVPKAEALLHWLAVAPQEEQAMVVVIHVLAVPQALLVFQCAK